MVQHSERAHHGDSAGTPRANDPATATASADAIPAYFCHPPPRTATTSPDVIYRAAINSCRIDFGIINGATATCPIPRPEMPSFLALWRLSSTIRPA